MMPAAGPDTSGVPGSAPETALCPDTVLSPTTWCVLREQPDEYLVYNVCSEALHLISPLGRYLYLLCDGLHTIAEIEQLTGPGSALAVREYLAKLVDRGLVEPLPGAGQRSDGK